MSTTDDVSLLSQFFVCIDGLVVSVQSRVLDSLDLVPLIIEITYTLEKLLSVVSLELHISTLSSAKVDVLSCCLSFHPFLGRKVLFLQILI